MIDTFGDGAFERLQRLFLNGGVLSAEVDSDRFEVLLRAATAKALEFNVRVQETGYTDGVFYEPFLRGLLEEVIYLHFLQPLGTDDRLELLDSLQMHDFFRTVGKQKTFFQTRRPQQPVYRVEFDGWDGDAELTRAKLRLEAIWSKLGWPKRPPSVRDLAVKAKLSDVYDYLYAATSRVVHFTPQSLLRLGWATIPASHDATSDSSVPFTFSSRHFAKYHSEFTRFYGAFIFLLLYELLEPHVPQSEELAETLSSIRHGFEKLDRWPELITFEEMNMSVERGRHLFEFSNAPLGTTLVKGLPLQYRRTSDEEA